MPEPDEEIGSVALNPREEEMVRSQIVKANGKPQVNKVLLKKSARMAI